MSLANLVQTDASAKGETDTLGGGRPRVETSDMFQSIVKLAYLSQSSGGAYALNLHLDLHQDGKVIEHREQIYFTNKQKQTFYTKDNEKHSLPGFILVEALAQLTTGQSILTLPTEEAVVKLYNFDLKKEVPTTVSIYPALMGQPIYAGIAVSTVNKREKGGDGQYHPIAETRQEVNIDKVFRAADKMTTPEIRAGETEAKFFAQWVERFKGKVLDRTSKDVKPSAPKAASPLGASLGGAAAAPAVQKPSSGLFG